jgi:hydroxycarboxylate dehydrogenase B
VLLAGEPERRARREREAKGFAVDDQTWGEIVAAAGKVGARIA